MNVKEKLIILIWTLFATLEVKWMLDFRGGQIFHPTYSQWALKFHLPSSDLFPILWIEIFDQIQGFQEPTLKNILFRFLCQNMSKSKTVFGKSKPPFQQHFFVASCCFDLICFIDVSEESDTLEYIVSHKNGIEVYQ